MHFRATPKYDLPQYSFISNNTEPLGTQLQNVACYRLVTMLYLEIQKSKDTTKISYFHHYIIGTVACTKIIIKGTQGFGQLLSNNT